MGGALAALFATVALAQTTYWELEPKKDSAAAFGTYTAVGGKTSPAGVNFTLKHNEIGMPLVLTLVAKSASAKLHLSAFKEAEPFLEKDTDGEGRLTVKFRTGENMRFRIIGPEGAEYQLSLWRGPEIRLPPPGPVVSMDSVIGENATTTPANMATNTPANAAKSADEKQDGGSNTLIYVLLAGILIVLGVIAFLMYRGQLLNQSKGGHE